MHTVRNESLIAQGRFARLRVAARDPAAQLCALIAVAVLIGGGGVGQALHNLAIQLFALLLLAVNGPALSDFFRRGPRPLAMLVALTFAVPLLQLVPLPPSLWMLLPGRDLVIETLTLIGREDAWRPFTLEPNRTLIAAFSLVPVLAVLVLVQRLDYPRIWLPVATIAALGFFSVLLGAVQYLTRNEIGAWFDEFRPETLNATFANRNSTALFLDICLAFLIGLSMTMRPRGVFRHAWIVLAAMLVIGVPLTGSRSGMLMLGVVLIAGAGAWLTLGQADGRRERDRSGLAIRLGILGLGLAALGGLATVPNIDRVLDRFSAGDAVRPEIWEDARATMDRYWPLGSGIGTFDEVAQVDESLEHITPARSGRAHSDFLETAIGGGVVSILLIIGWLAWLATALRTAWGAPARPIVFAAALCLLVMILQSVVDYPWRNQALLCVAGLAAGLIARSASEVAARRASEARR